ncbi:hypothetical protein DSM25558_5114 [Agrobacterium sp. DSM 25558]|nr:hypothetical protein DSM25558_5114 [Agrobacterium sp. DSM 25558]
MVALGFMVSAGLAWHGLFPLAFMVGTVTLALW